MASQDNSNALDSGVLRTTRAFKKQLESRIQSDECSAMSILSWSILGSLSQLRKSLREVCEEIGKDSVALKLIEDDEFGWPRLSLSTLHAETLGVSLVVGGQDRRNGTVLTFKLYPTDLNVELTEKEYLDNETIHRTLRLFLRKFFDLVSKKVEEDRSVEKQFSSLFESFEMPSVDAGQVDSSEDLFPTNPSASVEDEEEGLQFFDDDFFK
jgi:hypothetical protein